MTFLAAFKLTDEFQRLIWDPGYTGAIDLRIFFRRTRIWFLGQPVYGELRGTFPPASNVLFWPFVGWLPWPYVRYLWALTTVAVLIWLCRLIVRESGARTTTERLFIMLMLLSMNATGVTIGNGQFILHLLPLIIVSSLTFAKREGWFPQLRAAMLFLIALIKPNVTAPFFLLVIFLPGAIWPALLVIAGYVALSFFAASFQPFGLTVLIRDWLTRSQEWVVLQGYGNVHSWLGALELSHWIAPVSLILLVVLGLWIYLHRHIDIWLLLAVTALVARFCTYHNMYDDLLILLPLVCLFRIAIRKESTNNDDLIAGGLLGLTMIVMLLPARMIHYPTPWQYVFTVGHTLSWLLVLVFLIRYSKTMKATIRKDPLR